jgi:retron-type reverse transcriptase
VKIDEVASYKNLELAWRRITTGRNAAYKRYFRSLYYSYEIALQKNLTELRARIKGGSFVPGEVRRIYLPKQSGLHRPITLLSLEDQIVLQAIANLIAKRIQPRRKPLQMQYVFSSILKAPQSIFFFYDWKQTYRAFQRQIEKHYQSGLRWVGDFDLAAFYGTISHELLLRTAYPRLTRTEDVERILGWLGRWASVKASATHGHGIPQGPIASDFLAECFLLPVDRNLALDTVFVRYVDDLRMFGKSEEDVRRGVISLEVLCRERGLIPQVGKYAIKQATSLRDALGMLPSIAAPHDPNGGRCQFSRLAGA